MPTVRHTRTLRDGRVLTWTHIRRKQPLCTPEDYVTDGVLDGERISDAALVDLLITG